jgi:uncharacterized repeat protein (TIGR01451 family)
MNKLASFVAGTVIVPALVFSTVSAAAAGQIEGGDIYRVKNVTKNVDFSDPANATCGDTVQFKVRIHNPGPDALTNVNVKATMPAGSATSHSSTVTVSAENANPNSRTDTAGVNLDKAGKLSYVNGSTELLDANNSKLSTFGDTIFTSGVTIESVGVSTEQKRFVQFQAKVNCDTTTTTTTENKPEAKPQVKSTTAPAVIAATGPASTIATMTGLSALAAGIGYFVQRRRNILG